MVKGTCDFSFVSKCCKENETKTEAKEHEGRHMCSVQTIRSDPSQSQPVQTTRRWMLCARIIDVYGIQSSTTCRCSDRSDARPPTRAQPRPRPIPRYPCPQTTVHAPAARCAAHGQGPCSRPPRKSRLLPVPEHERTRHQQFFHAGRHERHTRAEGAEAEIDRQQQRRQARAAGTEVTQE